MKNLIILLIMLALMVPAWTQRRTDLPFKEKGKWWYNLENKKYGPFDWVSDIRKNDNKWLFISEIKKDTKRSDYFAYTNAGKKKTFGPYDYINARISGFSPSGSHFYFMAFRGDKETGNQKYYFVIDGKQYGPYTNVTRKVK